MASFQILTFGCKVNQCDSQILRETLNSWGFTEAEQGIGGGDIADVIIINTCTVTGAADSKFRKALHRKRRGNPRASIIVTGCYANRLCAGGESIEGVDMILAHRDLSRLADFLSVSPPPPSLNDEHVHACPSAYQPSYFAEHTRAFLKIQDGCDCYCAYCVVPTVRAKLWSEKPENVVTSINALASKGYREVVLTGIHLGFFGRGSVNGALPELLRRIETQCEIDRIRISSVEINEVSDEVLELIAGSRKLCHHLHLPLQSGDDEALRAMGRKYSSSLFSRRIQEIRTVIPDIGITTDVMVGFPGETPDKFERTCDAIEMIGFTKIHVFRFSPRPGTRAANMDSQVPERTKSLWARRLIDVGDRAARRFKERFIGETAYVLAESVDPNENACSGLTSNYIRVKIPNASEDYVNRLIPVRIVSVDRDSELVTGEAIKGGTGDSVTAHSTKESH